MISKKKTSNEIDCVIQKNNRFVPIEIKSSMAVVSDFFKGLTYWRELTSDVDPGYLIYGGLENQSRAQANVVSWQQVDTIFD